MMLPTKAVAMSADQCTDIVIMREPQAEIRYKNRIHLVTCRARPLNHEKWLFCGTTNKNRGEQGNRRDGVENDPCFTAATLLDRALDNPPVTKSHNQKKRIQNRPS